MLNVRNLTILSFIVIIFVLIGSVSATDIDTNDTAIVSASNDEIISMENDIDELGLTTSTYSHLRDEIGSGKKSVTLSADYYSYDTGSVIIIDTDNCVIDGNGAVIDMAGSDIRAFSVSASGVTFKNLKIQNVNFESGSGGAIIFYSSGTVTDCTFQNNKATSSNGGALYFSGSGTVTNCNFVRNSANSYGGAVYFNNDGTVTNCNFNNNVANNGGAVFFKSLGTVTNCNFVGNSAKSYGGAVYFNGKGSISDSIFNRNSASDEARHIYLSDITDTKLSNNTLEATVTIDNSTYIFGDEIVINGTVDAGVNLAFDNVTFTINSTGVENTSDITNQGNYSIDITSFNLGAGSYKITSMKNSNFTFSVSKSDIFTVVKLIPSLTVVKTANVTYIAKSHSVNYTIVVKNTGVGNATDVCVVDNLPEGLILGEYGFVPVSGIDIVANGVGDNGVMWNISSLDNKTDVSLWITAKLSESASLEGNVTNYVNATFNEDNVTVSNNTNITVVPVILTVNKTADVNVVVNNTEVKFTIVVNNTSLVNATGVTVVDNLPDGLTLVEVGDSKYDYKLSDGGKTITWTIPELVDSVELYLTVRTAVIGNLTNNVAVTSSENKTSVKDDETINVIPYNSTVEAESVSVTFGDSIDVPVTSENATEIIYQIIGEDDSVVAKGTVKSGENITGLDLSVGKYTVNLTTVVDEYYASATNTSGITVNPAPSTVEGQNLTVNYGEPIVVDYTSVNTTNVTYEIIDENDKVVANGTVGSKGSITVDQLPVGNYTVNWASVVDGNHVSATNTSSIEVSLIPTVVTIGNVTAYLGENVTIPVSVALINGDSISGNVTVVLPDNSTLAVEIINGSGSITWLVPVDYTPDTYSDSIKFSGTDIYAPSNGTGSIEVVLIPTEIASSAVSTVYNVDKNLVATLTDVNGNPLSGVNVTVDLNGAKTYTTDENGQVKVSTNGLAPKTYTAKITFDGNDTYAKSTKNVEVTVKKATPKLTANKKTFKTSVKTKKYTVVLKDNTGKAINKAKVTLKVNGKTYKATTNSKGKATFKITKLNKKGSFKATITYNGNTYYNKVTKKATIKVVTSWKTVSKGSKLKTTVKKIQRALKNKGYYTTYNGHYLKVDGIYWDYTVLAVKEFQHDKGLKVTGKVDEKTAQKLGLIK